MDPRLPFRVQLSTEDEDISLAGDAVLVIVLTDENEEYCSARTKILGAANLAPALHSAASEAVAHLEKVAMLATFKRLMATQQSGLSGFSEN